MRTDIRLFRLDKFGLPADAVAAARAARRPADAKASNWAGRSRPLDSRPHAAQPRCRSGRAAACCSAASTSWCSEHGDLVRSRICFAAVDPALDKFAALHAACWSGGTLLYVPARRGRSTSRCTCSRRCRPAAVDFGHTLVVLEEGAEATLLAETASLDRRRRRPALRGDRDARRPAARGCGTSTCRTGAPASGTSPIRRPWSTRDAALQWTIGALGSRLAKVNQHVALVGRGADAQVNGVMFTEGKQHLSYHTLQHHQAPAVHERLALQGGAAGQVAHWCGAA